MLLRLSPAPLTYVFSHCCHRRWDIERQGRTFVLAFLFVWIERSNSRRWWPFEEKKNCCARDSVFQQSAQPVALVKEETLPLCPAVTRSGLLRAAAEKRLRSGSCRYQPNHSGTKKTEKKMARLQVLLPCCACVRTHARVCCVCRISLPLQVKKRLTYFIPRLS